MKSIAAIAVLILILSGCGAEYAGEETQKLNTLSDADNPEIEISGRSTWNGIASPDDPPNPMVIIISSPNMFWLASVNVICQSSTVDLITL